MGEGGRDGVGRRRQLLRRLEGWKGGRVEGDEDGDGDGEP